ncbi:HtaA domain-containing protein [Nocardioides alkalitolerans]|uniref:HtaA domain-containing protein n=1 Tax=Nocardioides alkalitolerans TaxID=281714 RepID=UPI0004231B29|nr:HtaA domain-containing protein [Nocardioides alkalitolerans]
MSTLTRAGARRGARATAVVAAAALVSTPLALTSSPATAADEPTAAPALAWEISEQFDSHLSTHTLADGATEDAAGVITFPNGVGTYDAGTGVSSVAYEGSVTGAFVNAGNTFYSVTLSDPVVSVDAAGDGTVSATVSSFVSPAFGGPATPRPAAAVEVTTFDVADGAWTTEGALASLTATPRWDGVLEAGSEQATALGITRAGQPVGGRSFSPAFLGQLESGVRAHFYASAENQPNKTPAPLTAQATPAATPAVTYQVTGASYADGLDLSVSGTSFRGATNPGDNGVYVGLAEAGEMPDVSDRGNTELFAGVNWVPAAGITDGAFRTAINAPTEKLDPTKSYSLYTWQAHTHSNTTQDTETPVEIDWSALEAPVVVDPGLGDVIGSTGQRYGTTTWIAVKVQNVEDGTRTVTLTGAGTPQTVNVQWGQAAFRVPAGLAAGSYTPRFTLNGTGLATAPTTTGAFTVLKGVSKMNYSFTRAPSSAAPGYVLVAPSAPSSAVPRPTGLVAAKIYLNNRVVATITTKQLANGQVVLAVPRLAPGRYVFHVAYGGSANLLASHSSRYIQVR